MSLAEHLYTTIPKINQPEEITYIDDTDILKTDKINKG